MTRKTPSSQRRRFAPLALSALAAACLSPAQAVTHSFACASSSWEVAACWSPAGVPLAGDTATIGLVGANGALVLYSAASGTRSVSTLTVDASGTGSPPALRLTGGDLSAAFASIGAFGQGAVAQSGGVARVDTLVLGSQASGLGRYELSGGQLLADIAFVGAFGEGQFTQSGGAMQGRAFYVGTQGNPGSATAYTMTGGTLDASVELRVGRSGGKGAFVHSNGVVTAATVNLGVDGQGSYAISGAGRLNATVLNIGTGSIGNGSFTQSGASTNVAATTLSIGAAGSSSNSSYRLNGGFLNTGTANLHASNSGGVGFEHIAGTHTVNQLNLVGNATGERAAYALKGGALASKVVAIGAAGAFGDFVQTAGSHNVATSLSVAAGSSYTLQGGQLTVASGAYVLNEGSFVQRAGAISGNFVNQGEFTYGVAGQAGPQFNGLFVNQGVVTLHADPTFGGGVRNEAAWPQVMAGRTLTVNGQGMQNLGTLPLAGGTLQLGGPLRNDGSLTGWGRIEGGAFVSTGSVQQAGGNLVLASSVGVINQGLWTLERARQLQLETATTVLMNQGQMDLAGASVRGAGTFTNQSMGVITGSGSISVPFANQGTLALAAGDFVTLATGAKNTGLVDLRSASALLGGGSLANSGLVVGQGRVSNAIDNTGGRIRAEAGVLVLSGSVTGVGELAAGAGGTLQVLQTLGAHGGTIRLDGGIFDGSSQVLNNQGLVSGFGSLRTAGIENHGQMQFTSGQTQVFGPLHNRELGQVIVSGGGSATFYDDVKADTGSEIRVSADSRAIFFGKVSQDTGAGFTGRGTFYFEGGFTGAGPALTGAEGDVVLGSANVFSAPIAGPGAGVGHARFAAGGALSFGGVLKLELQDGFGAMEGQRFDLFDWGSADGRFAALDFSTAALAPGLRWDTSQLYVDGSITVTAVPEPGSSAMWLAGLAGMGWLVRRRRVMPA